MRDIQVNPGPMDLQQPLQVAETALIHTPHAFNTAQMLSGTIAGTNSARTRTSTLTNTLQQGNLPALHALKPANKSGKLNAMQTIVVLKQSQMNLFQTVNHASVLWNPLKKPKGIFGGHINIRSVMSKTEQLEHLLLGSNLHYLCLSETWITATTPVSAFMIPGYKVYKRDRGKGKGGGVIDIPDLTIECVGVTIKLSPQMSFIVLCVYRPPNATSDFDTDLTKIFKTYERKEILLMGDLNLNWLDKGKRKHLKDIANSIQMTQLVKKPTRITKNVSNFDRFNIHK